MAKKNRHINQPPAERTKHPRSEFPLAFTKKPRSEKLELALTPVWAFHRLDIGGPWCWSKIKNVDFIEVLRKMGSFEGMDWAEHRRHGSHLVAVGNLCKEAQKRLDEIGEDDLDDLFSFRFSGKERMWGVQDRNVIKLLWWDPNHEVCPSEKKGT